MATIKISQLPLIPGGLSSNTSNSIFLGVDIPSGVTGRFTATQLASKLYSNNTLVVGQNPVVFSNTIGQFSASDPNFTQVNLQNFNANGASDFVLTADTGTNSNSFIDLGINNSIWNPVLYQQTSQYAYDGYLIVQGPGTTTVGNLVVGTAVTNTSMVVAVGGQLANNITARFTPYTFATYFPVTFADGTTQNTAAVPVSYSQAGYSQANTAYNIASSALQNTSTITVSNNLIVPGTLTSATSLIANNVKIQGNTNGLTINNSVFPSTTALVRIDASNGFAAQQVLADGYMLQIQGKDGIPNRIIFDATGTSSYPAVIGRLARGTAASPTSPQAGDVLFRLGGNGYGTTGYSIGGSARIDFVALDNFSDTTKGTQIQFWATAPGSSTNYPVANLSSNTITFSGTVNPQRGFIWNPYTYPGSQTAITLDFANNSVIRANTSAGLTVSFANYTPGKVVEMWVTNTSGQNQTFTHGCPGIFSTTGSTSYAIPSASSVYAKYTCFDSANVFVAIVHS